MVENGERVVQFAFLFKGIVWRQRVGELEQFIRPWEMPVERGPQIFIRPSNLFSHEHPVYVLPQRIHARRASLEMAINAVCRQT